MTTFVYYFVPEDKEDQDKLNVFVVYKPYDSVRLSDIKENFPLTGQYYFRFKYEFMGRKVWIDFNNPDGKLPQFDGKVIMKVTRLGWNSQQESKNDGFPDI